VDIIQAALLQDTVEDTDTSFDEIETEFGVNVCDLVRELTDDKSLLKAERKRLQVICLMSFLNADTLIYNRLCHTI
jgi:guanosine-3',5'-bis(diphosphate) 3'-pyrophosphohydrolase